MSGSTPDFSFGRRRLLAPGWIVYALFPLYPIFWLLGLGAFIYAIAFVPLSVWVLSRPHLVRPPAVWLFAVYIVWAGFSVTQLDRLTRLMIFGLRYAGYMSALLLAYYVYNERRVLRDTFVKWVAMLWVWSIVGGYLGLIAPHTRLSMTPASLLVPRSWRDDPFVSNMVQPRFAQVQSLVGDQIPRPSALFSYTNSWGAAVGLLTPFFIAATILSPDPRRRRLGVLGLVLAIPPILLSVNRGLWLSISAILIVVAVRSFLAGHSGPLKLVVASLVAFAGVIALTPIGAVVNDRLSESSANARAGIYQEAWEGARTSPILGWGSSRPSTNPFSPSVGTHGHFWYAMFAHGIVGLALYVSWVMWSLYRVTRRSDAVSVMLGSVVFVGALQMFFYSFFSTPFAVILIALGLYFRPEDRHPTGEPLRDGGQGRETTRAEAL